MSNKVWNDLIKKLITNGFLKSSKVIKSLRNVSRESFLPESLKKNAAMDCPLPIGSGQTASAPLSRHIVVYWAKHGINNG